ncbi:MAG: FAD-dependent oxidoreductase [Nanoarchaeota archaeon]|nr:FAD-dependent oxidoreductase [Nanoarchaeota archaeon]
MKVGIIGGGYSGLGAAYYLNKEGVNDITILEYEDHLGGLASGFKRKDWKWPIEKLIHHWFTTDSYALGIAREIGLGNKLIIKDTKSSCFYNGRIAELDSATSLLRFPFLSFLNRIRLGMAMAYLRFDGNYLKYEKETSYSFIKRSMGKEVFKVLWEPLFQGKFGKYAEQVNAAWFWARIHPRTKSLAYIEEGFDKFTEAMAESIKDNGGKIILNSRISKITKEKDKFAVYRGRKKFIFDYLILAVPLQIALKMYNFPEDYKNKFSPLNSIGAQYFVLELKNKFLEDGTYWLNINDKNFPFMMVAEHTNFVDKKNYGESHIIWVGKYLDYESPLWKLGEKELLDNIIPFLQKINPKFEKSWIKSQFFSRFKNAQPILPLNYSKKIPEIETPIKNLLMLNMNQVYPWDRGTNNALGLGYKAAKIIKKNSQKK